MIKNDATHSSPNNVERVPFPIFSEKKLFKINQKIKQFERRIHNYNPVEDRKEIGQLKRKLLNKRLKVLGCHYEQKRVKVQELADRVAKLEESSRGSEDTKVDIINSLINKLSRSAEELKESKANLENEIQRTEHQHTLLKQEREESDKQKLRYKDLEDLFCRVKEDLRDKTVQNKKLEESNSGLKRKYQDLKNEKRQQETNFENNIQIERNKCEKLEKTCKRLKIEQDEIERIAAEKLQKSTQEMNAMEARYSALEWLRTNDNERAAVEKINQDRDVENRINKMRKICLEFELKFQQMEAEKNKIEENAIEISQRCSHRINELEAKCASLEKSNTEEKKRASHLSQLAPSLTQHAAPKPFLETSDSSIEFASPAKIKHPTRQHTSEEKSKDSWRCLELIPVTKPLIPALQRQNFQTSLSSQQIKSE